MDEESEGGVKWFGLYENIVIWVFLVPWDHKMMRCIISPAEVNSNRQNRGARIYRICAEEGDEATRRCRCMLVDKVEHCQGTMPIFPSVPCSAIEPIPDVTIQSITLYMV